jgi:hypothetical protein
MDESSINAGGWASYDLNKHLNNKVYKAFPLQWKQLLKQVIVRSSAGHNSTDTPESNCYIFVPSASELNASFGYAPYSDEGTIISHFADQKARICYTADGEAVSYWTRSPNVNYPYAIHVISAAGTMSSYEYPNAYHYVRIMFTL